MLLQDDAHGAEMVNVDDDDDDDDGRGGDSDGRASPDTPGAHIASRHRHLQHSYSDHSSFIFLIQKTCVIVLRCSDSCPRADPNNKRLAESCRAEEMKIGSG